MYTYVYTVCTYIYTYKAIYANKYVHILVLKENVIYVNTHVHTKLAVVNCVEVDFRRSCMLVTILIGLRLLVTMN